MSKVKEEIEKIHKQLAEGNISVEEGTELVVNIIKNIDYFDIDASKRSKEDKIILLKLFSEGNISIKPKL